MRGLVVCSLLAALLGACQMTPDQEAGSVCTALCKCAVPDTPAMQQDCVENQCLPAVTPVSQDCLDCVALNENTCPSLLNQCVDKCLSSVQTSTPGGS